MTTLVSVIINKAVNVLNDAGATRWTSAELLDWASDGQREIAVADPSSSSRVDTLLLAAGTKQSMPADVIELLRINRNMGPAGLTPGESPRPTSMALMDLQRPGWNTDTAATTVKNYMYDKRLPDTFYVWPPISTPTYVEIEYTAIPLPLTVTTQAIGLDDTYQNAILDYVLYRAFEKDSELAAMQARSQVHYAAFQRTLGIDNAKGSK